MSAPVKAPRRKKLGDKCWIYADGRGVPVEGKPVQRCIGIIYWWAHGRTLFDIRDVRRVLGVPEVDTFDPGSIDNVYPSCSVNESIVLALVANCERAGRLLSEVIAQANGGAS